MTDPTAKNRRAVAETIFPSNSALYKSLASDYQKQDAQVAVDEANNMVQLREQPTLPIEVQDFVQPGANPLISEAPSNLQQTFVNPVQSQGSSSNQVPVNLPWSSHTPGLNPLATYNHGANLEANTIARQGMQEAEAYQGLQESHRQLNQQIQDIQTDEEKAFQRFEKEDLDTRERIKNFQLEPKNFFAGKNTWQKILGGVGMFLGSITPEGARNVAGIIDKEIEYDLERQKSELALLKDSRNEATERYKMKLQQLGSHKLAKMSMKKDALEMVKLKLDQIAASAKGDLARSAALKGRAVIEQEQSRLHSGLMKEYLKVQQDMNKSSLPGYVGANQNPAVVKELTEKIGAQRSAVSSIDQLEKLLAEGSIVGKNRSLALQVREKLAADLAKAMFGRSSDSELEVARGLIPDITSVKQRKTVDKELLRNLRLRLSQDMDAATSAAGYSKAVPFGARKINNS